MILLSLLITIHLSAPKPLQFGNELMARQHEMSEIYKRAKAIACAEGYYKDGTLPQRNKNPGNLKKSGYPRDRQGHSIFKTDLEGWMELRALLYERRNMSIEQISVKYAADSKNWIKNVKSCRKKFDLKT